MLQIKEIPICPEEFEGALCLFDLAEGIGESEIRAFEGLGNIVSYEVAAGSTPFIVRFSTHAAAVAVAASPSSDLKSRCSGVCTQYNERSYDGREGQEGLEDDHGRGW